MSGVGSADYIAARAGAREFLDLPKVTPVVPVVQRCLLSGHDLEPGQEIAACVICDQQGCPECLDCHNCLDYERVM